MLIISQESDSGLYQPALESLRTLIRTSTSSMTSVPKPLKFLRPFYEEMGKIRDGWSEELKEQRVSGTLVMVVPGSGTYVQFSLFLLPFFPSSP